MSSVDPLSLLSARLANIGAELQQVTEQMLSRDSNRSVQSVSVRLRDARATMPIRGTEGSAGWDLFPVETEVLHPAESGLFNIGITVCIPSGYYGRIAPRSGLSLRGVDVGAGVVDSDFRGIVHVLLRNHGPEDVMIHPQKAIAQLIITRLGPGLILIPNGNEEQVTETGRGSQGWGSTDGSLPKSSLQLPSDQREPILHRKFSYKPTSNTPFPVSSYALGTPNDVGLTPDVMNYLRLKAQEQRAQIHAEQMIAASPIRAGAQEFNPTPVPPLKEESTEAHSPNASS